MPSVIAWINVALVESLFSSPKDMFERDGDALFATVLLALLDIEDWVISKTNKVKYQAGEGDSPAKATLTERLGVHHAAVFP